MSCSLLSRLHHKFEPPESEQQGGSELGGDRPAHRAVCPASARARDSGDLRGCAQPRRSLRRVRRGRGQRGEEEEEPVRGVQEEGGADRVHVQVRGPLLLHTQIQ